MGVTSECDKGDVFGVKNAAVGDKCNEMGLKTAEGDKGDGQGAQLPSRGEPDPSADGTGGEGAHEGGGGTWSPTGSRIG